jgi:hypothetical protein
MTITVKELIKQLEKCDPNIPVHISETTHYTEEYDKPDDIEVQPGKYNVILYRTRYIHEDDEIPF